MRRLQARDSASLCAPSALPFFDYYLKNNLSAKAFLDETLPVLSGIRFETTEDGTQ